jgi:hypothetical protein
MISQVLADLRAEAPILAGSAGVVVFMVVVAYLLGFRARARLDEAALQRLAATEGASVEASVIDADGGVALARLADGRLMVARAMGADVSARVTRAEAVRVNVRGGRLSARFADLGFPPLQMRLQDSPAWLSELPGAGGSR